VGVKLGLFTLREEHIVSEQGAEEYSNLTGRK